MKSRHLFGWMLCASFLVLIASLAKLLFTIARMARVLKARLKKTYLFGM